MINSNILNAIIKYKTNILIKYHICIKYINIILLLMTSGMFLLDRLNLILLPKFAYYSSIHTWFWIFILIGLGIAQLMMISKCKHVNNYRWSNSILIISGLALLIVGCLFGFKYPPYTWQMTTYPFIGFLLSLAGRNLNKVNQVPKGQIDGKSY